MRFASRIALALVVVAALGVPSAQAASSKTSKKEPTATTAAPVTSNPQPAPGSAFGSPVQGLVGTPTTETTVTATKRAGDTGNGRSTLLFLSLVALLMIAGVAVFIWHEGRSGRSSARRRRQRMRSGRTPQPVSAGAGSRRGPPPPPRKRRAQAAKRKKR